MTFRSSAEIESYIRSKLPAVVKNVQQQVFEIFMEHLVRYYAEYEPTMYERTYQLLSNCLDYSGPEMSGGKVTCKVFYDPSRLDYSYHYINGVSYPHHGWTGEDVVESAAHGMHGGKIPGTAIYDTPLAGVSVEYISMFRAAFAAAGIPVK